ncbi:MAG: GGDEF domain-containing protein [Treponema sp.]|nr:GGDEF domain-containing protein [Treponema sp.]
MKKDKALNFPVSGSIIAAICIVIYLIALVQGAVRLYLSVDERKITAEREFSHIADLALSAGIQGFMDDRFVQTMNNALASSKSIEALIITGPDNSYAFEKQTGRAISWVNNTPRFINRFSYSDQSHYRPLAIPDVRNANIKAVAGAFDYDKFIKILKDTLLIIMTGFALAFFTILVQLLMGKGSSQEMVSVNTPDSSRRRTREYAEQGTSASGPKGLYSTRSNIGWEEYTKDRLNSELHRCASTEKDLALVLLDFTDIAEDRLFKQAAEEAINFFTSKDLLFEYGDQGITVILPGSGFEAAIAKSEKFYQRILDRFSKSYMPACGLCIGLSSRSGRLLNADRLILEAGEALKKAKEDSKTSIIAFKSDPEKYRAFIASQS